MDNILVKKMTLEDLNSISGILEIEFDNFWNYNIFKNEINNSICIVAKIEDEIVGFAGISIVLDTIEINNIVVKKSQRGKGLSSYMMKEIINIAQENNCTNINLEVNCNNSVAINLYKKFGFVQVGLRKGYYNGDDALLFSNSKY